MTLIDTYNLFTDGNFSSKVQVATITSVLGFLTSPASSITANQLSWSLAVIQGDQIEKILIPIKWGVLLSPICQSNNGNITDEQIQTIVQEMILMYTSFTGTP